MTEEQAKVEALKRWHDLPEADRRTRDQAAEFALRLAINGLTYDGCSHPYHFIKGWLQRDLKGL